MNLLDLMVKIGVDDQASQKIAGVADKAKSIAGGVAKAGAAAVAATSAVATGVAAAVSGAASQVAEYGDNIDKMSQKMGMSAEAYQEWDAVMQHSGTSMETMKAGMKTLANAAETGNEAFQQLGLSQEQIANMSQEELFEATIAGLQGVEDTTQRTYLAGQLLGRGATELGALLNTSAEDTQAMRDRVHELGGVMSDEAVKASARFQDSLQDMQTAMGGLKRNMMAEFLPGMATVMDGLGNVFSGDTANGASQVSEGVEQIVEKLREAIPKFIEVVGELLPVLVQALSGVILSIAQELPNLVMQLVPALLDMAPTLLEASVQVFMSMVQALTESGPGLIDKMVDTILQLVDVMIENLPMMLEAAGILFMAIAQAILQRLPDIVAKLAEAVAMLVQFVVSHAPEMLAAAGQLFMAIVQAVAQSLPAILGAVGQIGQGMFDAVGGFFQGMFEAGANLIQGFVDGILSAPGRVVEAVTGVVGGAIDGAKRMLGIASPSKVFRGIGENTMLGLQGGILGGIPGVERAMSAVNDAVTARGSYDVSANGGSPANGGSQPLPGIEMNIYLQGMGQDGYELGRLVGKSAAYELRMQGVCA